jgi:cardiolipin synthase
VLAQFFIVDDDEAGRAFAGKLIAKAAQGVRVYFLYDQVGSRGLSRRYVRRLEEGGVRIEAFGHGHRRGGRFQVNFRNHRKVLVADGNEAFVGGLNVGDEYLGRDRRFGPWRDTHVAVRGPAVQAVQVPFVEDWCWVTGDVPELDWKPEPAADGNLPVLVLPTGPADELPSCHLSFLRFINSSRRRLWITSPYFVPDHSLVSALQLAALRGVDVRIMLPQKPDHILVYLSAFSYFREMLQVGVRLYRYEPGFMHQKVWLIDDSTAMVGTPNLDNRSCYLNFELMVLAIDPDFGGQVREMLERDFDRCREVTAGDYEERSHVFKLAVRLARLASPVQ